MATEIERKFLLLDDSWYRPDLPCKDYRQGYLPGMETASVRFRIAGDDARLNIKSATLDIQRQEYEYPVPLADAVEILTTLCGGRLVEKKRYLVEHGGHTWEIDVFEGDNAGLVVAEIELDAVDEAFERPAWLGKEVSDDPRYYNVNLLDNPFKSW